MIKTDGQIAEIKTLHALPPDRLLLLAIRFDHVIEDQPIASRIKITITSARVISSDYGISMPNIVTPWISRGYFLHTPVDIRENISILVKTPWISGVLEVETPGYPIKSKNTQPPGYPISSTGGIQFFSGKAHCTKRVVPKFCWSIKS